ncbi:hypothetical protein HDE_03921 [Halotydeus destructor]|nr:hypothetical protein HDE_03921 [Halotydeus destructor]
MDAILQRVKTKHSDAPDCYLLVKLLLQVSLIPSLVLAAFHLIAMVTHLTEQSVTSFTIYYGFLISFYVMKSGYDSELYKTMLISVLIVYPVIVIDYLYLFRTPSATLYDLISLVAITVTSNVAVVFTFMLKDYFPIE